MKIFGIFDKLGMRHSTIQANSHEEALEKYYKSWNGKMKIYHFAIEEKDLKQVKKNFK